MELPLRETECQGRSDGGGEALTTRDREACKENRSSKEITSGTGTSSLQRPHRGREVGGGSKVSTHRDPDSANVTRPKHGSILRHEYRLLAP